MNTIQEYERQKFVVDQYHETLRREFHGELVGELKPLGGLLGVGAQTVRNNGGVIRINGVDVQSHKVGGRIKFDLREVAEALAARPCRLAGPSVLPLESATGPAPAPRKGRPPKTALSLSGAKS